MDIAEEELQALYTWVDSIPLSRPKRNIARDFSDGVLMAEIINHFAPKLVDLHNYSSANSTQQKMYNWTTLNTRVLKRLGCVISKHDCEAISNCQPGAIERALKLVKVRVAKYQSEEAQYAGEGYITSRVSASPLQTQFQAGQESSYSIRKPQSVGSLGKSRSFQAGDEVTDKEQTIKELREANEVLDTKVRKLEQLVKLKDAKIQTLVARLQAAGLA